MNLVTKKLVEPEEAHAKAVDKTGFEALLKRPGSIPDLRQLRPRRRPRHRERGSLHVYLGRRWLAVSRHAVCRSKDRRYNSMSIRSAQGTVSAESVPLRSRPLPWRRTSVRPLRRAQASLNTCATSGGKSAKRPLVNGHGQRGRGALGRLVPADHRRRGLVWVTRLTWTSRSAKRHRPGNQATSPVPGRTTTRARQLFRPTRRYPCCWLESK